MNKRSLSTSALHPTNILVNYARPRQRPLLQVLKDVCCNSRVAVRSMILPAQESNPSAQPHDPRILCHSRPSTHAATPKRMAAGNAHPSRQRGHPSSGHTASFNQIDQSSDQSIAHPCKARYTCNVFIRRPTEGKISDPRNISPQPGRPGISEKMSAWMLYEARDIERATPVALNPRAGKQVRRTACTVGFASSVGGAHGCAW